MLKVKILLIKYLILEFASYFFHKEYEFENYEN